MINTLYGLVCGVGIRMTANMMGHKRKLAGTVGLQRISKFKLKSPHFLRIPNFSLSIHSQILGNMSFLVESVHT